MFLQNNCEINAEKHLDHTSAKRAGQNRVPKNELRSKYFSAFTLQLIDKCIIVQKRNI